MDVVVVTLLINPPTPADASRNVAAEREVPEEERGSEIECPEEGEGEMECEVMQPTIPPTPSKGCMLTSSTAATKKP